MVLPEPFQPWRLPLEVPVVPGADEAAKWAREELAHKVYQDAKPGLAEQIGALLQKALYDLFTSVGGPDANVALAVAAGVVVLAVAAIIFLVRPRLNRKNAGPATVFDGAHVLTAEQHRAMARTACAAGDFGTGVSEQFRAIVRAVEERDVSLPSPGRTAREIAAELELAFPPHALALRRSADLFNAVRYGHVPPSMAMYEEIPSADKAVAATKPVYPDRFPTDPSPAGPSPELPVKAASFEYQPRAGRP